MTTNLTWEEVEPVKKELVEKLYEYIPVGVGGKLDGVCDRDHLRDVMLKGAGWALENGFAVQEDIDNCEENGCLKGADPSLISDRTIARGKGQLGTVGAGNHYIEVQRVDKILDEEKARVMDLHEGQVVVMIHTGSRGLGHQVADENMKVCSEKFVKESLPDKQLAAPSFHSEEGQKYLRAMYAAANFVWCNRQVIMHNVRRAFSDVFKDRKLETHLVYDVAHNIAKVEKHNIDGVEKEYIVHRKGATRAFGPGRQEISEKYRSIGQPNPHWWINGNSIICSRRNR
ncbi:hypothetical protein TVAG_285750 [Trichomonas vaginalis G3]|uniref:3'-phosphate/5'-hydroxy nucleic acid ligase n=1 Tax=Trichomonas vaginalis (strain ATCC PRA-98 / G3) TaxID=412133 RepID=A2G6F7_TRIV3|nr:hypothetical protein TVAG_285750 [Trichomonas vaginalis G3]|eukprot:XP_001300198.1 hypothetical protein [Trichomonas vaginalis G3]